jgi:hypothetical protein
MIRGILDMIPSRLTFQHAPTPVERDLREVLRRITGVYPAGIKVWPDGTWAATFIDELMARRAACAYMHHYGTTCAYHSEFAGWLVCAASKEPNV